MLPLRASLVDANGGSTAWQTLTTQCSIWCPRRSVSASDGRRRPSRHRRYAVDLAWTMALVVAVMALIARYFWLYGKSTVWRTDGLAQHYPALYAFNQWIRGIVAVPESGVPLWSWNLGLGADILGTLAWPVIGDPFALVSLAFPMSQLENAFMLMLALRVVAAGAAAAVYFRKMGAKPLPAATGVVLYVFVSFLLIQGRHPYFINAMVFLPLLLLGVEMGLRDRKLWPLALVTFLAAMANFYFFYILTIITVLYAAARYFELTPREDRWRRLLPTVVRVGGFYALGAALAAPLLIPSLLTALGTARAEAKYDVGLFYPAWVYASQVVAMASSHFGARSTFLGFGYLAWLTVPVLFLRRGSHTALKFLIVAFAVFVTLPWFGSLFNGFTFPSNRFAFAWGLFLALGAALVLSEDEPLTRRDVLVACAAYAVYVLPVLILAHPVPTQVAAPMVLGAATLCVFAVETYLAERTAQRSETSADAARRKPWVLWAILGLVVANVVLNGSLLYDKRGADMLFDFEKLGQVQARYDNNLGRVVRELPKDSFYRVENSATLEANSAIVQGFPSTSFYFSTMNGHLTEFRQELDSRPGWSSFSYDGFDERAAINTLLATRYYLARPGPAARARVPYGFYPVRSSVRGAVYANANALPLGFVYERAIDRSDYMQLDPVDRQAAMLQGVVLDDGQASSVPRIRPVPEAIELTYTVLAEDGATFDQDARRIERTRDDASIVISIPPVTDAELYVEVRDFDNVVHPPPLRASEKTGLGAFGRKMTRAAEQPDVLVTVYTAGRVRKLESWRTPGSTYYWGNHSQLVNLGYQRGRVTTIGIEPRKIGTLTFESLKVYALPMEGYSNNVDVLQANAMRDIEIGTNRVSGRVRASRDGLLFLSIPYSSGWSATVDGEPVETVRANTGFTGVPVPPGEHAVVLTYVTPGLRAGLAIALATLCGLVAYAIIDRRRRRAE